MNFITELKERNEILWYFSLICLTIGAVFLYLSFVSQTKVSGVNAWFKPFKFALSIAIYTITMAWICHYLTNFNINWFNWCIITLLGFEIIYITIQAYRGQMSHFNVSTPLYAFLYNCMAIAASAVTIYTVYIAYLFFKQYFPQLPDYYIWAIRLGLVIFVVFSFEGFAMGARMNHSVGTINDQSNIFILGWSKSFGDLRVAHFIGMHALQVLPLLSFYLLKNSKLTITVALLYFLLAMYHLFLAIKAKPFVNF